MKRKQIDTARMELRSLLWDSPTWLREEWAAEALLGLFQMPEEIREAVIKAGRKAAQEASQARTALSMPVTSGDF